MSEDHAEGPKPEPKDRAPVRAGRAIVFFSVAALAIAATGIFERRHEHESLARWTDEQAIPTVALVSPQEGSGAREVVLPGNVEAFFSASIHGQVSGYLREWRKDIGANVKQGDVLAVVDTPELDQSIAVAQSELEKAKANLALAKVTAARWNSLRNTAAVSQQAVDEKDADARARAADVDAAQSNVDRLKAQKAFANIVATVRRRRHRAQRRYRVLGQGGIERWRRPVHHRRHSSNADLRSGAAILRGVHEGRHEGEPRIAEYPDRTFDATIVATSHAIDKKSRTLLVELIADNKDGALSPGAFAASPF